MAQANNFRREDAACPGEGSRDLHSHFQPTLLKGESA